MTRRRWMADEVTGNHAALTGEHADHLVRVLRARVGQEFDIATGVAVRRGRVTSMAEKRVEFELGEELPSGAPVQLTLLLAVFKFDRMEWAIEKCTELGVSEIVPVISRRTDAHLAAASAKRTERWRRIAQQASEQSRRSAPPGIATPLKLSDAAGHNADLRIVLAESEDELLLREVLKQARADQKIILAVGPEGGWTEDEMDLFKNTGWTLVSLGQTILRAETAAIAAAAIVLAALN
jgi:16S rRNA (uracil1498-N3)-methyltransferase